MKCNQQKYIEYVKDFANKKQIHFWLGGSFLYGNATTYSDVDISAYCDADKIRELIYGYGKPVYISYTSNPLGILIVLYEDGVAVDLEVIEKIDVSDKEYFHMYDIKSSNYIRNVKICRELSLSDDISYQVSRLFHRSLIKYLSGKRDIGVSIANEIVSFMNFQDFVDGMCYKEKISNCINAYNEKYRLTNEYYKLLCGLIEILD